MIQNTLKLISRSFFRNKSVFLINLIGLTISLTSALLIYFWIYDELKVDQFLKNDNGPFELIMHFHTEEGLSTGIHTPCLLAENLKEDVPEIENAVPTRRWDNATLSFNHEAFKTNGLFVGQAFFQLFNYELLSGDPTSLLANNSSIVISETIAQKIFNTTENLEGKVITLQQETPYQIAGVFKSPPANATLQFDFAVPYEVFKANNSWAFNWNYSTVSTFLSLNKGVALKRFNEKIGSYLNTKRDPNQQATTLEARDVTKTYLYGHYEDGQPVGGRIQYVRIFSIVAILILLIACINFMNLSTAMAAERSKEIGVKKVIGISRKALIFQFFTETLALSFIALLFAIVLSWRLMPLFNEITGKNLTWGLDWKILSIATIVTLLTGLIAGSYPSFFLSGFKLENILKGKSTQLPGGVHVRKALVVGQFILSFIMMAVMVVIYQQINYLQTKNLGFNKENLLEFDIEGKVRSNLETFLAEINQLPGVSNASSIGESLVGGRNTFIVEKWEGKPDNNVAFEMRAVNFDLIETLDIELANGRTFSKDFNTEDKKVIFNESAIEFMGLKNPIGKEVEIMGDKYEIIGITKNIHYTSLHEAIGPQFFVYKPTWSNKVLVRIEQGQETLVVDQIRQFYASFNPGFPINFRFLDDAYQSQYMAEQRVATLSKYAAILAIFISCLGLYGLATYDAKRRFKEIGIRKVLGASILQLTTLLSGNFLKLILLAILIATPMAYYLASGWLDNYAYRIDIQWRIFIMVGFISILISLITISFQSVKAAMSNPVEVLKDE